MQSCWRVCVYVCMCVCRTIERTKTFPINLSREPVCLCGFGITIEDSNKGIPSPRSTIEWEQLFLDRHTMGELELLYRFIPLLQRGRQYSPRA